MKILNREQLSEAIDGDYEVIRTCRWRWGTEETIVFQDDDGKHWMMTLRFHSEEGLSDDSAEAFEVRKTTKTVEVVDWIAVEEGE